MIIHRLVYRFMKHQDDEGFYLLQTRDTVRWLKRSGIDLGTGVAPMRP